MFLRAFAFIENCNYLRNLMWVSTKSNKRKYGEKNDLLLITVVLKQSRLRLLHFKSMQDEEEK